MRPAARLIAPAASFVLLVIIVIAATAAVVGASGVVGTGTSASCTDAALDAALTGGGLVTFNCGAAPATIDINTGTSTKTISADTTIDGGGLVTIGGGGTTQIFVVDSAVTFELHNLTVANEGGGGAAIETDDAATTLNVTDCVFTDNVDGAITSIGTLVVSGSTFTNNGQLGSNGAITGEGSITITDSTFSQNSGDGGGAIHCENTVLTVTGSTFSGNNAGSGGAIESQGGPTTVTDCIFGANSAMEGGAIFNGSTNGFTIINSTFYGNSADADGRGGAIVNDRFSAMTVMNTTLFANSAGNAGGAIANGGTLSVIDCTLLSNAAAASGSNPGGGAIDNEGMLTVTRSTFSSNKTEGDDGGGAVMNLDTLTVSNSTFSENSASTNGGAIANLDATLTVTDSTFSGNSASGGGGGVANSGTLSVANSTFSHNNAFATGGAIANLDGTLTVTNSTFSGNATSGQGNGESPFGGGAIENEGTLTLNNSTFSSNGTKGIYGGGAILSNSTATVTNTILANNSLGGSCGSSIIDGGPDVTDGGHNIDDGTTCGFSGSGCSDTTGSSFCNTTPLLDPAGLADNGGPTETIALEAGSPAINAGDESVCAAAPVNNLDQRGAVRPGTGATSCSIGAYEFNAGLTRRFLDDGDGTVTDSHTGLQWEKKSGSISDTTDCSTVPCSDPHAVGNLYQWCLDANHDLTCDTAGSPPDGGAFTDFLPGLNAGSGFAGHTDWRLPTVAELQTIVNYGRGFCVGQAGACIDPIFGPTTNDSYLSATADPTDRSKMFQVNFEDGQTYSDDKADIFWVRAVRGPLTIGVDPSPGVFIGTTNAGTLTMQVGSIEALAFPCNGTPIDYTFTPAAAVDAHGTFDVLFSDSGHDFHVSGQFSDNDHVTGNIDDDQNQCTSTFIASRQVPTGTPSGSATPTATPTPPFVPPDKDSVKCEDGVAKSLAKLATCVRKCHIKQAATAFKGTTFDEEACEVGGSASCRAQYDTASAKLIGKSICPACLDATTQSGLAGLLFNALEAEVGDVYCAGTTAFGDDDPGFVPPDKDTAKCEQQVAAIVSTLATCVGKCGIKQADVEFKGTSFDKNTCESAGKAACRTKYDAASAKLEPKPQKQPTCPACLDVPARAQLGDSVQDFLKQQHSQIYCAGTVPLQ